MTNDRNRRAEDKYAHLEKLAFAQQEVMLSQKSGLLEAAIAEHKRDCDGYKFKCERWGNFLNVSISRMANPGGEYCVPKHWSGALNLDLIGAVTFVEGHAPDCEGEVTYRDGRGIAHATFAATPTNGRSIIEICKFKLGFIL